MDRRAKVELVEVLRERYVASEKHSKSRILDELVQITGYQRKYALRLLRKNMLAPVYEAHGRRRIYDDAVKEALIVLWEASDRICGQRLKTILPDFLKSLVSHEHLKLDVHVRELLLAVSAASIDRQPVEEHSVQSEWSESMPTHSQSTQPGSGEDLRALRECGLRSSGSRFRRTLLRNAGWFLHSQFCDYGCRVWLDRGNAVAGPRTVLSGRRPQCFAQAASSMQSDSNSVSHSRDS